MISLIILTNSGKIKKVNYRDVRGELSEIPMTHRGSKGVKIALSIRKAILVHPGSRVLLFIKELRPMGFMAEGLTGVKGKKVIDILEDPWTPMEIEAIEKEGSE